MRMHHIGTLLFFCLCIGATPKVLHAQDSTPVPAEKPSHTGLVFSFGGMHIRKTPVTAIGSGVRFRPDAAWCSMDATADLGIWAMKDARHTRYSLHLLTAVNLYPGHLRRQSQDGARTMWLPVVSAGFGVTHATESNEDEDILPAWTSGELHLGGGIEVRHTKDVIVMVFPWRHHWIIRSREEKTYSTHMFSIIRRF